MTSVNPLAGTGVFLLGGVAAALYLLPFRAVKGWSYETGWLVSVVAGWLVFPLAFDALVVPDLAAVLQTGGVGTFLRTFAFGALWGIGALCWALMVRYLGVGLGLAIGAGLCAATGTLLPPIVTGHAADLVATRGACTVLGGVLFSLLGIALVGAAGRLKENEMSAEEKLAAVKEYDFRKGLVTAVVAGFASAGINFALQGAPEWEAAALAQGASPQWAGMPVLTVTLWGGLAVQIVWVAMQHRRNRSLGDYLSAPAGRGLANYLLSASVGVVGVMQFVLQKVGEPLMGPMRYISFGVLMASAIFFSTLVGASLGEWRGTARRTRLVLAHGLGVLLLAFMAISLGGKAGGCAGSGDGGGADSRIDVYPQSFEAGGWGLDVQLMDTIGSPYLIAHGRGIRVTDATAKVTVPVAGKWHVFVRTRKWVDGAGRFKVAIGGRELDHVFGRAQSGWAWEKGGEIELAAGESELRLVDLDGFDARVAGVVLNRDGVAPEGALSLANAEVAETVDADFVVVGGGLPGTCAAVAAARRGLRVALVNDRPVLGGNASSEIRVWSAGEARYQLVKELRGWFMNRDGNMALSDANRMRIVTDEKTLSLHLCMRAFAAETAGGRITSVKALDWRRNRVVRFRAPLFCDATGDGWVGYWAGADYRMGREAKSEYGESFAPEKADGDTLGASLMWTSAEANTDIPFSAPWAEPWAKGQKAVNGEWNWEYGIHHDMFADAEWIRDRLLLAIYGAFSLAKKDPENSRRVIDFLPFILGKRESRRLMGDWVYSENDIREKRQFEDAVASGSWSVDLHYDDAKEGVDFMTTCRQPHFGRYYIPYRSIYSRNVENLFMVGRCFSCTHVGLGGPRVMNTLAQLGVAAGEAAAMCKRLGCGPRGIWTGGHHRELQRNLGGDFPGNPDPKRRNWRIVDDDSEAVTYEGSWHNHHWCNGEQVGDKAREAWSTSVKAIYRLPVDGPGKYRLYGKVPYHWMVKKPSSTAITVENGADRKEFRWDQTRSMGEWIDLGVFDLDKGARLVIDAKASTGTVIADGFAISPEGAQP